MSSHLYVHAEATAPLDVMSELRQQTRAAHTALEELMPFFRPEFSRENYISLLERFLGILEPLESRTQRYIWQLLNPPPSVHRARLLQQDLIALDKNPAQIAALPRCEHLPEIGSTEEALGVFYVLEGSMLGGQAISRELRTRFSLTPDNGASFFASSGIDVKARWSDDQRILRTHFDSESKLTVAISSANATFRSFYNWFAPRT